eukprot:gene30911-35964_t
MKHIHFTESDAELSDSDASTDSTQKGNGNGAAVEIKPLSASTLRKLAKMGANYRSSLEGMEKLCCKIYNPLPMYRTLKEQLDETKVSARFCCPLGTFCAIGTGSNVKSARLAATSDLLEQLANLNEGSPATVKPFEALK